MCLCHVLNIYFVLFILFVTINCLRSWYFLFQLLLLFHYKYFRPRFWSRLFTSRLRGQLWFIGGVWVLLFVHFMTKLNFYFFQLTNCTSIIHFKIFIKRYTRKMMCLCILKKCVSFFTFSYFLKHGSSIINFLMIFINIDSKNSVNSLHV